jgi:hypothetical protein
LLPSGEDHRTAESAIRPSNFRRGGSLAWVLVGAFAIGFLFGALLLPF